MSHRKGSNFYNFQPNVDFSIDSQNFDPNLNYLEKAFNSYLAISSRKMPLKTQKIVKKHIRNGVWLK